MAFMEFLRQNVLNTTTMITTTLNNGVGTFPYSYDRNLRLKYSTVGYSSNTTTDFTIKFQNTTPISHVLIQNHNLKQFRVFMDGNTATVLGSAVTNNSATSTYISFATVQAAQITLLLEQPMIADNEKSFGEIVVADRLLVFERNPDVSNWTPTISRKQIIHEMPDGGVKVYQIRDKFNAQLSWGFVTNTFHDNLLTLYSSAMSMYFIPFPTTTSWSGEAYEISWIGDFDFNYGENSKTQGFNGSMNLRETAGG